MSAAPRGTPRPSAALRVAASLLFGCGEGPASNLIIVTEDPIGLPIAGLDAERMARFDDGDAAFEATFRLAQGLGPLYIRPSCASCHAGDGKGPGAVTKMVLVEADGFTPRADQSPLRYGHTLRPQLAAGATIAIATPELEGLKISRRIGPAVVGRGYLEAIEDREIERVEAEQARGGPITGRINRVTRRSTANPDDRYHAHQQGQTNLIGRFGLKARIASVDDFAADAYQGDMGITSPLRPRELPNPQSLADDAKAGVDVDAETVNLASDYVRFIAIPRRAEVDPGAMATFDRLCAACHVPSLRTREDYPIPELAGIDAPVFSDLLLHDMGSELADGLAEESATGREWRTAPLMGLRFQKTFLHDGRASSIEAAILMHAGDGSEANDAVRRFEELGDEERIRLVDLVGSL
jgi:CxxC motif-containing protein (DUF1111 family)